MDFVEFAKWGIRVKEEPVAQDVQVENEAHESNLGESDRGWMCKFPCDADATIRTVVPNSQTNEFLEPVESMSANYLGEDFEYLNLEELDIPPFSALTENSLITESVIQPILTHEKDITTKSSFEHNSLNEKSDIACVPGSEETLKIVEETGKKQKLDVTYSVRPVPHVPSENSAAYAGSSVRESTGGVPKETIYDVAGEVAPNTKNQDEIFECSDVALLFDSAENVAALANVRDRDGLDSCSGNCLPIENCSLTDHSVGLRLHNKVKEKNEKSLSKSSFKCSDCGKILKKSYGFITHMKLHLLQAQTDSVSVKCKQCNKEFHDRKALHLHKKVCKYLKDRTPIGSRGKQLDGVSFLGDSLRNDCNADIWQKTSKNSVEEQPSHNTEVVWEEAELVQLHHPSQKEDTLHADSQIDLGEECPRFSDIRNTDSTVDVNAKDPGQVNNDGDVSESWSSEICKENQKGRGSSSGTLSLRLFRFRKPNVLLKHTHVADSEESIPDAVSPNGEETCSSYLNKNRTLVEERSVICDNYSDEVPSKRLTQTLITSERKECGVDSYVTNDSDSCKLTQLQKYSQKRFNSVTCGRSMDTESCDLQVNVFDTENGQLRRSLKAGRCSPVMSQSQTTGSPSLISDSSHSLSARISELNKFSGESYADTINNLILESSKQDKVRSDLKIRIKPVVVLDRLRLPEQFSNNFDKSFEENTETSKLISVSQSCDESLSQNSNSYYTNQNAMVNNATCENIPAVFVDAPNTYSNHQVNNEITQKVQHSNESKMPFEALEKQYCLKKCSVKLTRISVEESSSSVKVGEQIKNANVEGEVRKCGKLKLRRTSSKIWTVTSPDSDRENLDTASDSEEYMETSNAKRIHVSENSEQNCSFDLSTPQSRISSRKFKKYVKRCKEKFKHVSDSSLPSHISSGTSHKASDMLNTEHFKKSIFKCIWCQKIALNQEDLAKHLRTHNNDGYKCPNCSARFHFWMEMQSHLAGCSLVSLINCQKLHIV